MADNSTILEKLDGLVARFEETSTLITDPAVIADQKRYVKLTKEYKELDDLMKARKEYIQLLGNIEEAKNILANESDAEMREMAKEEMDKSQERLPVTSFVCMPNSVKPKVGRWKSPMQTKEQQEDSKKLFVVSRAIMYMEF